MFQSIGKLNNGEIFLTLRRLRSVVSFFVLVFCLLAITFTAACRDSESDDDDCSPEENEIEIESPMVASSADATDECSPEAVTAAATATASKYCDPNFDPGPPATFKSPKTGKICVDDPTALLAKRQASRAYDICKTRASKVGTQLICALCFAKGKSCA